MPLGETYKGYAETMWNRLSALVTWQPDVPLAVGEVVTAGPGGVVTRETTLVKLGVSPDRVPHSQSVASPLRVHSGVTVTGSGSAVVASAGRARASFSRQSSFLFVTDEGRLDAADRMADARAVVEDLQGRGVWREGWHLVTSVRSYPACTIVIAKEAGAEADVTVDLSAAGVAVPEGIRAGAHVGVNSDQASHWAMSFASTPLYEALGMKRRGLRRHASATQTEYPLRDLDAGCEDDQLSEEDYVWIARRSSPQDMGLL